MHLTMILQLKNKHMINMATAVYMLHVMIFQLLDVYTLMDGFFNPEFGEDLCVTYGGTPCPACDDVDADGVCDDEDDCVGSYDDCGVCNGKHIMCRLYGRKCM